MMYISVTGLKLNSRRHIAKFWHYATPSFKQAKAAAGNIYAAMKTVDGYEHTMTVWQAKKDMKAYAASGAHLQAMKIIDSIATGKIAAWEGEDIPSWNDALARWHRDGV